MNLYLRLIILFAVLILLLFLIRKLFLTYLIKTKYNGIIILSSGRGTCSVCNKKLRGSVCQIKGSKKYYCIKHAFKTVKLIKEKDEEPAIVGESYQGLEPYKKKKVKKPIYPTESIRITKKSTFKGYCEFESCKKEIPYKFDRFLCPYCKKWHCPEHRLPENHGCGGNPPSLPSSHREIFSRGGRIVTGK